MSRNVQRFPSGEVRVFEAPDAGEGEEAQPMVLVEHVRAPEDTRTTNLLGKTPEQMPPPFEAVNE